MSLRKEETDLDDQLVFFSHRERLIKAADILHHQTFQNTVQELAMTRLVNTRPKLIYSITG